MCEIPGPVGGGGVTVVLGTIESFSVSPPRPSQSPPTTAVGTYEHHPFISTLFHFSVRCLEPIHITPPPKHHHVSCLQRKHQDLRAQEALFTKRATKLKAQAAQIKSDYESTRTLRLAQHQQQEQRSRRQRQRQQQQASSWAEMRQQRQQRLAGSNAAAAAGPSDTSPLRSAAAAAPAGPPTPPASHCEAAPTAAAAETPSPTQQRHPPAQPPPAAAAAAAAAAPAALAALAAATAAAAGVGSSGEEGATGPSTPRGGSLTAPTPTSTPAAPGLFVFGAAAAAAAAATCSSPQQQQQQQQQGRYLSAAAVEANVAGKVVALADKGRDLQRAGDSEGALAAYIEALELDQDNVRVSEADGRG